MGSDGFATLKGAVQTGEDLELEVADAGCAKEAAGVCPVQIIEVQ